MAILTVELQDEEGNLYYLKTDANNVYCTDGISVQTKLTNLTNQLNESVSQIVINEPATDLTKLAIQTSDEEVELAEASELENIQYKSNIQNITDFDNITEPGLYYPGLAWENVSNVPNDTKDRPIYGYLRVTKYCNDANGICQELYDIYTGIPVIYIRRYFNGSWGSWYRFDRSENILKCETVFDAEANINSDTLSINVNIPSNRKQHIAYFLTRSWPKSTWNGAIVYIVHQDNTNTVTLTADTKQVYGIVIKELYI